MSGAVNRNDHRNDSYYRSVETGHGIEIENEDVADVDDHYLPSHCHDVSAAGGKDGCHRGTPNNWAPWVSVARRPQNGANEMMLVKKDSYLTIDMTIVDVRYVK